jgi:uncharacterized protein (DUF58 family)
MENTIDREQIQPFLSLEFLAKQVVEGFITGLHKSPFHGFSVEFAEHRLYNPGETTRFIDWKLFARTDKLFVKRFEEETNLRCRIIIDRSSSMYYPIQKNLSIDYPNKITFSVYAAAAIIQLMNKQRDAVGLSLFSDEINLHTREHSSTVHQKYLFTELEKLLTSGKPKEKATTSLTESLHAIAEMIHKRSLVILFSDMFENTENFDQLFSALQHFRHYDHEVVLFHVTDKKGEDDLNLENRPYRYEDMQTGEIMKLNPMEIREYYREYFASIKIELKEKCAMYRIDYVESDINEGFYQVLIAYLIKRGKLF